MVADPPQIQGMQTFSRWSDPSGQATVGIGEGLNPPHVSGPLVAFAQNLWTFLNPDTGKSALLLGKGTARKPLSRPNPHNYTVWWQLTDLLTIFKSNVQNTKSKKKQAYSHTEQ